MNRLAMAAVAALSLTLGGAAEAQCTPGTNWTETAQDLFSETTYTITAPCKVYVGTPFDIVLTVDDPFYPDEDVGMGWAVLDNGVVIAGGGFNWITTAGGTWSQTVTQTYPTLVVDHIIQFQFKDLGNGAGAHFWSSGLIGSLTVDPYPPAPNSAPTVDAGPDVTLRRAHLADATLNGAAADAEGDALTYRWFAGDAEIQPAWPVGADGSAPLYLDGLLPLSLGTHTFTLEVTDGVLAVRDEVALTVVGNLPRERRAPPPSRSARSDGWPFSTRP